MAGLDRLDDENSPPVTEPITLDAAKAHLRVDHDDEDGEIEAYIAAARSVVEGFLKQSLIYTFWQYRIDGCFPSEIRLPIGPLRTTDGLSIQYVDDAGVTQTLAASEYLQKQK